MKLYEVSPGYFYDDTHKRWSLFKENNGQWRLEDLANDTRSDHPSFGAAVSALKSHVGDVTVHRKQARMPPIKTAVIKLAQANPEFRKSLVAELKTAGGQDKEARQGLREFMSSGYASGRKNGLKGEAPNHASFNRAYSQSLSHLAKLKDLEDWWSPIGPPYGVWAKLGDSLSDMAFEAGIHAGNVEQRREKQQSRAAEDKQADKWEKKPKGWTDESRKKFWDSLTSAAPKHKVTECIKRMNKHMGGNAGAFCASLADRVMPGWRQEAAKDRAKKGSSLTQPLSLRRDYGAGSDQDEWMDVEEVRKHCPPCADKMARNNIRRVKASVLRVAMQR